MRPWPKQDPLPGGLVLQLHFDTPAPARHTHIRPGRACDPGIRKHAKRCLAGVRQGAYAGRDCQSPAAPCGCSDPLVYRMPEPAKPGRRIPFRFVHIPRSSFSRERGFSIDTQGGLWYIYTVHWHRQFIGTFLSIIKTGTVFSFMRSGSLAFCKAFLFVRRNRSWKKEKTKG